jgi:hypothetical protein
MSGKEAAIYATPVCSTACTPSSASTSSRKRSPTPHSRKTRRPCVGDAGGGHRELARSGARRTPREDRSGSVVPTPGDPRALGHWDGEWVATDRLRMFAARHWVSPQRCGRGWSRRDSSCCSGRRRCDVSRLGYGWFARRTCPSALGFAKSGASGARGSIGRGFR